MKEAVSGEIPLSEVRWQPCFRIISTRFPTVSVFEEVADPADLEAVFAIESLTNERLRDEAGEIRRVAPEDRVTGPGSTFIMAAFTHVSPVGGRFTDETFGAYYAGRERETAIAESVHHRESFLRSMVSPPTELEMRVLRATLAAELHDVRGKESHAELYHEEDWEAPRALGKRLREEGSWGILYESVRREGGECAAVYRPSALSSCRPAEHLGYVWDGERISLIYEKRVVKR